MSHKKNYWQLYELSLAQSHPSSNTVYNHSQVYAALEANMENSEVSTMENGKDSEDIQSTRSPLLELPNEVRRLGYPPPKRRGTDHFRSSTISQPSYLTIGISLDLL